MTVSPWVMRGCRGCGTVIRRKRSGDWFCSRYCERTCDYAAHVAVIATTPMHVLYPQMMAVLTWAQEQRPSYKKWAGR